MIKDNVKYIVINYSDSDYMNNFIDIAEEYCNHCNKTLQYWKSEIYSYDKTKYDKAKITFLTDITYINNLFINKLIGSIIKSTDFSDIINVSEFQNIVRVSTLLMSNIKFLSSEEFEDIKGDLECLEYLVIYFENEKFNYKIY